MENNNYNSQNKKPKKKLFSGWLTNIKIQDKIFFTQNLEIMIKTGFSIAEALKAIVEQTPKKQFKKILTEIQERVEGGENFSNCLRNYPRIFSELYVSMIETGEISGKLEESLRQLTIQMKKNHTLVMKVKNALTYPVIVLIAMVGIGTAMLFFVVPKITAVYSESGYQLPLATKIVIGISDFVVNNFIYVIVGLVILIVFLVKIFSLPRPKRALHKFILRLPIAGSIIKKINIARFARTLASLLSTDIPIVKSFQVISKTLGNTAYKDFIANASEKLKKGVSVFDIIKESPFLFPPIIAQMLSIGEQSGSLDTITSEIANFYEEEIDSTMSNLAVIIEPILMLILGAGVGLMAIAVVAPMYSLVNQV